MKMAWASKTLGPPWQLDCPSTSLTVMVSLKLPLIALYAPVPEREASSPTSWAHSRPPDAYRVARTSAAVL
jgi:hypothetical protein